MIDKLLDALSKRAATTICMLLLSVTMTGLGTMVYLGKAAVTDYTEAIKSYDKSFTELRLEVSAVYKMSSELRLSSFTDKVRSLSKQAYKLQKDPGDIKPSDMISASDFCVSQLFSDYKSTVRGSDVVWINKACRDADSWISNHNVS